MELTIKQQNHLVKTAKYKEIINVANDTVNGFVLQVDALETQLELARNELSYAIEAKDILHKELLEHLELEDNPTNG